METPPILNTIIKVLVVIISIAGVFIYKSLNDLENTRLRNRYEVESSASTTKIDSLIKESEYLNTKIDSLNEIKTKKDSVIITITKSYEKDFITISNQPISNDVLFFTNYLSEDNKRFVISNNPDTIKKH